MLITASLNNKDISDSIKIDSKLDTSKVGDYVITYSVTNIKGRQERSVTRTVKVRDDINPVLKLKGDSPYKVQFGSKYKDPGYIATDNYDGDITDRVEVQGIVDTKQLGVYKLYYIVQLKHYNFLFWH